MSVSIPATRTPTHRYEVGVALQDLPPAEALHQCFDNLNQLNNIINDVFTRLSTRIKNERAKVATVVGRVSAAEAKVKKITQNQNKVHTLYSSAKYPAPKVLPEFERLYDEHEPHPIQSVSHTRSQYFVSTKERREAPATVDTTALFTELSHTSASRREKEIMESEASAQSEGLGRLPAYLPSASSILLFNTDQNPYKKYLSLDNLEGTGGEDRDKNERVLASAPISIIEGVELPTFSGFTMGYQPGLGEVPTFNMPQNLPLGRLADISFGSTANAPGKTSIAPSVADIASLPSLDGMALPAPPKASAPASAALVPAAPGSVPPGTGPATVLGHPSSVPAAPGAPPPPMAPAAPTPNAPPPPMAPAPPPPPMAPAPPTSTPGGGPPPAAASTEGSSGGGMGGGEGDRSSLLEAIRNSSIKALKKVDKDKQKEKKEAKGKDGKGKGAAASGGGGDLMSALRARLAQRHNAISGKNEKDDKAAAASPASDKGRRPSMVLPRLSKDDDTGSEAGDAPADNASDLKASLKRLEARKKKAPALAEADEEEAPAPSKRPEAKKPVASAAPKVTKQPAPKAEDDSDASDGPAGPALFKKVLSGRAAEVGKAAAHKTAARKPSEADLDSGWQED